MSRNDKGFFILLCSLLLAGLSPMDGEVRASQEWSLDRGLDEISGRIAEQVPRNSRLTVAVVDFRTLRGEVPALGRYVTEALIGKLFKHGHLRIIERVQLERALKELQVNQSDLFDPATTKKLGRYIGADAILSGNLTLFESTVEIHARLFSTERGEVLATSVVTILRDDRVNQLWKEMIPEKPFIGKSLSVDGIEAPGSKPSQQVQRGGLYFENDLLRIEVKSLANIRGNLVLELLYENRTDQTLRLASSGWGRAYAADHKETYLLGDTGEKWLFKDDTQVGNHYGGIDLIPHRGLLNRITFMPEEKETGVEFSYVGKYGVRWKNNPREPYRHEEVEVIIPNIRPGFPDSGEKENENLRSRWKR
ncbi:MAG: hypothetical protein HY204_04610 [Nitrospirae bacterium]|nr:hypothetical protein [Nitrospirota bacterium]